MREICSRLTNKTPERRQWSHFGVFIVNFGQISTYCSVSINFEQVNTGWGAPSISKMNSNKETAA